jgi:formate C-acetyltransferase
MSLELCLHPESFASAAGVRNVAHTVRGYFARGGKHVQFNVMSANTLRQAQKTPAAFPDLIVRIGGCSAYFTQLSPQVQQELVDRTDHATVPEET